MNKGNRPRKTTYDLKVVEEDLTSDQATCPKGYPWACKSCLRKDMGCERKTKAE